MKLSQLRNLFYNQLKNNYVHQEIDVLFFQVLFRCMNMTKTDYYLHSEEEISVEQIVDFQFFLSELKQNKPIQYLFKEAPFYGLSFYVDKNVLIPRQETEELVDWILKISEKELVTKVIDIGTGSGCIAISLAKNLPNAQVSALDISESALKIAHKNALHNNVSVEFLQCDILQTNRLPEKYDIIVSNPPYVRLLEKAEIAPNVIENEPHIALFVPNENPLLFYEKIADLAKKHLSENGKLFFEINQYLGKEMCQMLSERGFAEVELRCDLSANDRMIMARL